MDRVNRSRMVLVIAWGLLATGILVQLFRPGSDTTEEATDPQASEELAFDATDPDDADEDIDTGTDLGAGAQGADESADDTVDSPFEDGLGLTPEPTSPDDPALWNEAGAVLAEESFVATVTTAGVASLFEAAPGPVQHYFPSPTQFGNDRAFLVLDQTSSPDYVKVSLPVKPNGQVGWIPRNEVEITSVDTRALVDLSDDSVTVWDGDEIIVSTKAVTGKPSTPTPVGVFYVRDVIPQPNAGGSYGPYILALSGFSEVLETFNGGLPALAIHGTNNPDQIGTERSSGCVRIPNDLITLLADTVPLGTPVTIVA